MTARLSNEDFWICVCAARLSELQPPGRPLAHAACSDLAIQLYALPSYRTLEPVAAAEAHVRSMARAA